jgi:uncharacterized protein with von Willebrand factor type A (vWA) domain
MSGTVERLAQMGGFLELVYKNKRVSCRKIVWLSDHGGDMTPFEEWDDALYATAASGAAAGNLARYYFYCYPVVRGADKELILFRDKGHLEPVPVRQLVRHWDKDTLVIIFSEGGAARGKVQGEGHGVWLDLYRLIRPRCSMLWLNPLSKGEWAGSSAGYLSFIIKMAGLEEPDLRQAIQDL